MGHIIYHRTSFRSVDCDVMSWQTFLDQLGAVRDGRGEVRHFGGHDTPRLVPALPLAVITASGPDTEKFLQGQLTCDMRTVLAGHWRLAMHLDLKGRGQFSYLVLPTTSGVALLTEPQRADSALAALKKYAVFSKIALQRDDSLIPVLMYTPEAGDVLSGLPLPSQPGEACTGPHSSLARLTLDALLLVTAEDSARHLLNHYTAAELGGADAWRRFCIQQGIGLIEPGGEGLWLPQALNYDLNDGVNFRKGCYLGQEVVARMHFKGKMKQRMQALRWQAGITVAPGTALRNDEGQAVGELVTLVADDEYTEALVVLRLDHEGGLRLEEQPLQWQRLPLPYVLPQD